MHLLALHGNGGGASRFALCHSYFKKLGVELVAHTLPGFEGRPLEGRLDWSLLCNDVREALQALPRPRALLGPGIGGSVALQLLQDEPDLVDLLILQSPVGPHLERRRFPRLMKPRWIRELARRLLAAPGLDLLWSKLLFRRPLSTAVRQRFFREYGRCQAFGDFFDLLTPEWFQALRVIDTPGVLLWGAKERVLSPAHVEALRPLLPNCQLRIEPSFDHFPMLEQPALFCEVVWQCLCEPGGPWLAISPGEPGESGKIAGLRRALEAGLPVPSSRLAGRGAESFPQQGLWAVRSAHPGEDSRQESRAGQYLSLLKVEPAGFEQAVNQVVKAQGHSPCFAMRMVEAEQAGVAFLEDDYEEDLVNWVPGLAEHLLHGDTSGRTLELARVDLDGPPAETPWQCRLQELCCGIRQAFGTGHPGWDIEWADDGLTCWLVQIRPIVRPSQRREWFTAANQREILPDPPSPLMVGVLRNCRERLFDYYRRFDPTLPRQRNFLELFWERPFLNLSLLHGMMQRWGLPTRLVTDNIGGGSLPQLGLRPLRMLACWRVHARLAVAGLLAGRSFRRTCQRMEQLGNLEGLSLSETLSRLEEVYVTLVHGMMNLTAAMSIPLALLRASGTLAEHNQYFDTATSRMMRDLDRLRGLPRQSDAFERELQGYVERHGHRGTFESDIARPRIADDPLAWVEPLLQWTPPPPRPLSWRARLTLPLAMAARPWVQAREQLRSSGMRAFAGIRQRLLTSPWGEAIFELEPHELERAPDLAWLEEKRRLRRDLENLELPDLIRRFDPLPGSSEAGGRGPWQGVALTSGRARGRVWRLREPSTSLPIGYFRESTILVARAVDPGWLPCFSQVAGVVIEIGGDLSHGSLLLRELGLPAITNAPGVFAGLNQGDEILLDGSTGTVRRLEGKDDGANGTHRTRASIGRPSTSGRETPSQ